MAASIIVTAQSGKYLFDGDIAPSLSLTSGETYEFDLSDSSLSAHPLRFKLDGLSWDEGVTVSGALGVDQIISVIVPSAALGTLSYYCANHSGMGNDFLIVSNSETTYIIPTSGLEVEHTGATNVTVNTPDALSLLYDGIYVTNYGTGSTTITATETVKGGVGQNDQTVDSDGIYAWNESTTKDLSITAKDVTGLDDGIAAINNGFGSSSISVAGDVTSTSTDTSDDNHSYGIYALGFGTDVTVFTDGDVTSNDRGVFAWNYGSGETSITSTGTVTAGNNDGIYAENEEISTASDITIKANNVNVFDDGIVAYNYGSGSTEITATGVIKGGVGQTDQTAISDGIYAYNGTKTENISISVKEVSGLGYGIGSDNYGTGSTIIIASDQVKGGVGQNDQTVDSDGIYAWNESTTKDLSITAKDVTGLDDGIAAINNGFGSSSISVAGDVTSTSTDTSDDNHSYGIYALGFGTDVTVFTDGDVTSNDRGVFAWNYGSGETSITSTGTVTAGNNDGIYAENEEISTASDITIKANNVNAFDDGIVAINYGSGTTKISVSGKIVGRGSEAQGIHTFESEANITVLATASVIGAAEGIETDSKADIVTVNGLVTGLNGTAILLGAGDDTVTLGSMAKITGFIDGGTGSDTANLSVAQTSLYNFSYNETTKMVVVAIDSNETTFKDFEYFRFSDNTVLMTASEAASNFTNHTVKAVVITQDGSKISDADVVMGHGANNFNHKSAADGSAAGSLISGSAPSVKASLGYSSSTKAISSQDALDALKLSVGLSTSAGAKDAFDFISADFNQDGKVSSQDALSILKYSVGLTTPEQAKWVFVDTNGDYSSISKSNTSYTEGVTIADLSADTTVSLTGILIGDVNDSYSGLIA